MAETRVVYVVVCRCWGYDDERYSGDNRPVMAFTDRKKAEDYLARREEEENASGNWRGQVETSFVVVEMTVEG